MAQRNSQPRATLTSAQRTEVFDKTVEKVSKQYFDPSFKGTDWPNLARASREDIIARADPEAFELAMHDVIRKLGTSHTGFFHQSVRRVPARLAIGATFRKTETNVGPAWIAQDVHAGGPAHAIGLQPMDVLLAVGGKPLTPQEGPMFPMR